MSPITYNKLIINKLDIRIYKISYLLMIYIYIFHKKIKQIVFLHKYAFNPINFI